ncbi:MAG: hypothetical protein R3240_09985 [Gammaproteobacteria bacterium]|nr:hypothetical protein [Gammaproteobacteria bacterium]
MVDFNVQVWNDTRIYMVDFGRARHRHHPHRSCPDVDRYGFMDDANADEHGPIVSCRMGQPRVNVRFYRTEIDTGARLYAVASDGHSTIRILSPGNGRLPNTRSANISFRPVAAGRTSIDIHYWWPDGPIIGRLYVEVRATRVIRCRFHLLSLNGSGFGNSFLGEARPAGTAAATHRTNRIRDIVRDTNHVLEPHGIQIVNSGTVNTAWTNAIFPGAGPAFRQVMQGMATSPNRAANRLNVFLCDWGQAAAAVPAPPFNLGFVALGPPVAWATQIGAQWNVGGVNHTGNGIFVDSSASPFTGSILAHEFGHIFHLSSMSAAGVVSQWHTIGDPNASRDDLLTRRRMMYPYTTLRNSNNNWRNNVGYGNNMGSLLVQRQNNQDSTLQESRRAYNNATPGNVYAP